MRDSDITPYIPQDLLGAFEFYSFRYAAAVLKNGSPVLLDEIMQTLRGFRITIADILKPGGNESDIPRRISAIMRPMGWKETRIRADLHISMLVKEQSSRKPTRKKSLGANDRPSDESASAPIVRQAFIDGHKIDYVKQGVAFDLEWNSKDQTFDRDLYAFRAFHDIGIISAAVLLTRSQELNVIFKALGRDLDGQGRPKLLADGKPKLIASKYGASTTWMGKLLYRLEAGRAGGCPVLAIGIRQGAVSDWEEWKLENPASVAAVGGDDAPIPDSEDDAGAEG